MSFDKRPSVNRRWHRADLYVTPLAMFAVVTIFGALLIVGALSGKG